MLTYLVSLRINHANLSVVFSESDKIPTLLRLAPSVPMLKLIVCIDDLTPETNKILTEWSASQNVQLKELREREHFHICFVMTFTEG